jgi:hypothetical protein
MKRLWPVAISLGLLYSILSYSPINASITRGTGGCQAIYTTCTITMIKAGLVDGDCVTEHFHNLPVKKYLTYDPDGHYQVRACLADNEHLKNIRLGSKLY